MKPDSRSPVFFYRLGIAAFFLAGFFLLAVFGAKTYRSIAAGQEQNSRTRALLSYFDVCAKAYDTEGAISLLEEDGRPVLVIADGDSGYGLRIYQEENCLLEDYGKMGTPLNPTAAQVIGETEIFRTKIVSDGTFTVTTDAGTTLFYMRSRGASDE